MDYSIIRIMESKSSLGTDRQLRDSKAEPLEHEYVLVKRIFSQMCFTSDLRLFLIETLSIFSFLIFIPGPSYEVTTKLPAFLCTIFVI